MSYTEVFGGETIAPSQLSYIAYESAVDIALTWPLEAPPDANVAADKIDVDMTVAALALIMPPADQISVGQDVLVRNVGSNTFSVTDFDGTEIGSVASGEAWYFVVIDNETEAGDWYAIEFGAGTSSATAAALAGAGLRAAANRLDQNLPTTEINGAYAITAADRATVLQSGGGTIVWTFASAATLTDGWFTYVINNGTGSITLTAAGGETIDGSATKVIAPTESLIVFSDGANLHSLGYGRSIINTISGVSINAAGMGTMVLTDTQVQAQVQDYVGTLTGDRIAEYGGVVGYWFVFNNTTGAFTLTLRTDSLDPGALVPQGSYSIVRSNGTNMDIAFTASSGTVTNIATGAGLTGGPITTTGTISMSNTGVVAGSYGAVSRTLTTTVNSRGQLTAIAQPNIAIVGAQVTDLTAIISAAVAAAVSTQSLVDNPIGSVKPWPLSTEPTGWLFMSGLTIGNSTSGSTARANADTESLFTALWNGYSNTLLPIFDSAGTPTTRGANPADDFTASKRLTLLDMRGRIWVGRDNMGGAAASRVTAITMTPDGNTLGATGGAQTQVLDVTMMPSHTHTVTDPGHTHAISAVGSTGNNTGLGGVGGGSILEEAGAAAIVTASGTTGISLDSTGSGTAFNKTQPGMIGNWLIRYA